MSDWLNVMLEEIARKKREKQAAVEERQRRETAPASKTEAGGDAQAARDATPAEPQKPQS